MNQVSQYSYSLTNNTQLKIASPDHGDLELEDLQAKSKIVQLEAEIKDF